MSKYWVLESGSDTAVGPMDRPEITRRLREGQLTSDAVVCEVGGDGWVPLSSVEAESVPSDVTPEATVHRPNANLAGSSRNWSAAINPRMISDNPIVKLLILLVAVVEFITGVRRKGRLTLGEAHLLIETRMVVFWVLPSSTTYLRLNRARVTGHELSTVTRWFVFETNICTIFASGVSAPLSYQVKCPFPELQVRMDAWLS